MSDFLETALEFPASLFSFAMLVIVAYWLFALLFGVGVGALDGGEGADAGSEGGDGARSGGAFTGLLAVLGLGRVPVNIVVSLLIAIAWFVSMAGAELIDSTALRLAVPPVALFAGWLVTWALVRPLRRLMPDEPAASRSDFVGRVCVIRTGRVDTTFGQAEVAAEDGSTAVIQVRAEGMGAAELVAGSSALIFGYDEAGEFFWVAPYDVLPDTNQLPH